MPVYPAFRERSSLSKSIFDKLKKRDSRGSLVFRFVSIVYFSQMRVTAAPFTV